MVNQEFNTPQAALVHYGKKGMKWGVTTAKPTSSSDLGGADSDATNEYRALTEKQPLRTGSEAKKALIENHSKAISKMDNPGPELSSGPKDEAKQAKREEKASKFDDRAAILDSRAKELRAELDGLPPGFRSALKKPGLVASINDLSQQRDELLADADRAREGRLTSGEKQLLVIAGLGAVFAGGMLYGAHQNKKEMQLAEAGDPDAILSVFNKQKVKSQFKTWGLSGYVQPSSWDRPEYELPAGHVFHRISTQNETSRGFSPGTYSTHSEADFNRYVAGFRQEKGPNAKFHHVTYTSKAKTKVPNLTTTVETLRETMQQMNGGVPVSRAQALSQYQTLSGGPWDSSLTGKFFANLQTKGYGAIVDEMDAGVIGESPIVFFDYKNANNKVSVRMSEGNINKRERSIALMDKPPRK